VTLFVCHVVAQTDELTSSPFDRLYLWNYSVHGNTFCELEASVYLSHS
jgi:hypothetical protein